VAKGVEALVEPSLLIWARQSAGYRTVEAAAQKARFPTKQLEDWENGDSRPTINQLRELGRIYGRPLAVFYLPEPPKGFNPMSLKDYRRLPEATGQRESPELIAEIRQAWFRREVALELSEDWEDAPPQFEALAYLTESAERVGARVRDLLGVSLEEQANWRNEREALRNWQFALEEAGVLVFQAWGVDIREMRGFSLTERPFPVVVVNVKDSPRGRIFSLMHELAHILLHEDGLCDLGYREPRSSNLKRIERFCNNVAAAALVPRGDLLAQPIVEDKPSYTAKWSWDELQKLSSYYKVSDQAMLRRLLTLGKTDEGFYWQTLKGIQNRVRKKKPGSSSTGGPQQSEKAVSKAGHLFTELVLDSYNDERITSSDLSDYLGVRLKHVPSIEELVRSQATVHR